MLKKERKETNKNSTVMACGTREISDVSKTE